MRKCLVCEKGKLLEVEDITFEIEGYVFIIKGHRCDSCNEEFPYEKETQKTITIAKRLGVWPEPMKLYKRLSKSGKGLVFRVPGDIEKQLKLTEHTEIEITKLGNKIIIEPQTT